MSFIGILTEHKNEIYLKEQLEKVKLEDVILLSQETIENVRNIKFDTFLLGKKVNKNKENIRLIAKNSNYFVINSDIKENINLLDNLDLTLITYGYNQKSTITASSIEENKRMICLQRHINNVYKETVVPQEIEIKNDSNDYATMELVSVLLLYGKIGDRAEIKNKWKI